MTNNGDPGQATDTGDVPHGPASILEVLEELARQVTALDGRVNGLAGTGPADHRLRNDRFRFERADPDSAAQAQQELTAWVPWLVVTYNLHDIVPPCWPGHDGLAEEIAGLYLGWCGAWSGKDARPDAVVIWHEQLARLKVRVSDWARGEQCSAQHRCRVDLDMRETTRRVWIAGQPADASETRLNRTQRIFPAPLPPQQQQPTNRAAPAPARAPASKGGN